LFLDDGVSGTLPLGARPAGAALLAAARAREIDVVATYRVDRLGRKLRVVLDAIEALAIPYRSLTEPFDTATAIGRGILGICGSDGWSSQRIADDLNARHVPTVYARDAREPMQGEIHGTRAKEGKRKRATAGLWSAGAVLRILRNETYAGRHSYGRRSARRRA